MIRGGTDRTEAVNVVQGWDRQDRGSSVLVEVRVRVREGLQVEAPLHLLDLEDQQVEVRHPEDRWDKQPQTQARVFAVTQQEADVAPEVMTGTIQVFDTDAYVLIDPGVTHSFISA